MKRSVFIRTKYLQVLEEVNGGKNLRPTKIFCLRKVEGLMGFVKEEISK